MGDDGGVRAQTARSWGPVLLVLGGVLFAAIGFRSLTLQREASRRARESRLELIRADLRADANRLLRAPRGRPLGHWRLEPPGQRADDPKWRDGNVRRGDGAEGVRGLVPSVESARVRDLELAEKAGRGGQETHAAELFELASHAHPLLLDARALPVRVRLRALQRLAFAGIEGGTSEPLTTFLRAAEEGVRIEAAGEVGPALLTMDLWEEVQAFTASNPTPDVPAFRGAIQSLRDAADHARAGLELRDLLSEDGATMQDPHWVLRRGIDIWLYPISALFEGDFGESVAAARVLAPEEVSGFEAEPQDIVLDPPFDRVVLSIASGEEGRADAIAVVALLLGMLVYGAGAVLVIRGWRQARLAARQQADFVASVSHELKTPIASVRAMAELMAGSADSSSDRSRLYAERIDLEMQRLGATVRNVLDAAQIERGTLPVTLVEGDPAAWAERLAERVAPPLEAQGVAFQVRVDAADGTYLFDPQALESVLLNFLDNAVKFSPGEKEIELSGGRSAAGYRVEVSDRGIGIDPAEESRVFGRFYRGEAAREGAAPGVGLGLHIARQIADRHGAALYARSRVGGGSVFGVELKREV